MISTTKLKCPHCNRQVLKRVILATKGKCNNCGYLMTGAITNFVKPRTLFNPLSV